MRALRAELRAAIAPELRAAHIFIISCCALAYSRSRSHAPKSDAPSSSFFGSCSNADAYAAAPSAEWPVALKTMLSVESRWSSAGGASADATSRASLRPSSVRPIRSSVTALSAFTIEVSAAFLSAASQSLSDCLKLCASSAS